VSYSYSDPLEIRGIRLANRIVAAPVATRSFTREGIPSDRTMSIYRNYASSGAGMVVVEHHAVHPWGRNRAEQPRLYGDNHAEALKPLVGLFKASGTPVIAQINFAGSMTADETLLDEDDFEYVSPSGLKTPRDAVTRTPRRLDRKETGMIAEAFVEAAHRAVEIAGYDGVMIHAAHGYLLGQFLSPLTNHREDAYGGSVMKRARLLFEITDAVRSSLASAKPEALVSVRLGAADHMPEDPIRGLTADEAAQIARELAELGADWIAVSGNHCGFGDSRTEDYPYFAPYAALIRRALDGRAPLDCAGGVRSAKTANKMLSDGVCDLVGIGRLFLSAPAFLKEWAQ